MIAKRPTSFDKEKLRMAGLSAKSEQCEFDIRAKLNRTTLSPSEKNEIVDFLLDNKFIDHSRYCGSFIRDKIRFSRWGRLKIKYHLSSKKIPSSVFLPLLDEIDEEQYMESVETLLRSKSKGLNLKKREDVAKLYRLLSSRGFESSVISAAIRLLRLKQEEDETE